MVNGYKFRDEQCSQLGKARQAESLDLDIYKINVNSPQNMM